LKFYWILFFSNWCSLWCNSAGNVYESCWHMVKGNRTLFNKSGMHQDACWKQSG